MAAPKRNINHMGHVYSKISLHFLSIKNLLLNPEHSSAERNGLQASANYCQNIRSLTITFELKREREREKGKNDSW